MMEKIEVKKSKWRSGCSWLFVGLTGMIILGAIVGPQDKNHPPDRPEIVDSGVAEQVKNRDEKDSAALFVAQNVIRQSLKNPSSAEFRDGYSRIKKGELVACGWVNGQNGFGAMAGAEPWLVIADQGIAMVRSFSNQRKFVPLWNRYCTGLDDRDKPMKTELFGIRFGSRRPANLKPFEGNSDVLVYVGAKPSDYLGVPIADAWFEADHDRVTGGSVSAKGEPAYERWRDELMSRHGRPSSVGAGDQPVLEWEWASKDPSAQLSYNPKTDQALLSIRIDRR